VPDCPAAARGQEIHEHVNDSTDKLISDIDHITEDALR